MNIHALIAAVVVAAASLSLAVTRAEAATPPACVDHGYVVGYAHVGENLAEVPLDWSNSIRIEVCTTASGIRYHKATANTGSERRELRRVAASDAHPGYPIALCRVGKAGMYMIDLAYYYHASITRIRFVEQRTYATWVTGYAERRDCRLIRA